MFNVQKCAYDSFRVSAVRRRTFASSATADTETKKALQEVAQRMQLSFSGDLQIILGIDTTLIEEERLGNFVMTRFTTEVVQNDLNWEKNRQKWSIEYARLGRTPVGSSKNSDEKRSAIWQKSQRRAYKNGEMSQDRIRALEATEGWKWEKEDTWIHSLQQWSQQYSRLGRKPSKCLKDADEKRAGEWQKSQRRAYKNGEMSQDRIRALEATEGWTWEEDTWIITYKPFKQFKAIRKLLHN